MAKVITFSREFPSYHPRRGEPTNFVEKFWASIGENDFEKPYAKLLSSGIPMLMGDNIQPKHTTIRAGKRWKAGDYFSPRVWSGKPYNTKQIIIAPDIQIKKVWDFKIEDGCFFIDNELYAYSSSTELLNKLSDNDGLSQIDLLDWFKYPKNFEGQIICWNEIVNY